MESMKTPVHDAHVKAGARMVPFAGFSMPVQYTGIVDEHMAVRTRAGLFDVSHMGEIIVEGAGALDYLQNLTCNNVARLEVGRAHYTGLMLPNGAFVDDMLIYRLADRRYLAVVNAANLDKDRDWFLNHTQGFDVNVEDQSAAYGQLALQGPEAPAILSQLTTTDLSAMRYYSFAETEVDGVGCIVSRTGYTGEAGFEIYAPADATARLWESLLGAGAPSGLIPVGLGARDTLRLEASMALYGNDINDTTTALEANLGWIVKMKKGDFIGRDSLARQREEGLARKLVGFEMEGRAIARHGYPVLREGREIGTVTSGTFAPFLEKSIGMAYLPAGMWEPGTHFEVGIRNRTAPAVVVPTPFYKRG
ncbi:MAG: glycine cleavage system aminomethyltransferase GcvT [Acidobacteria bacterium]|uniref:Aminomethyltransferase n=1 Tax=Candidatus Polarisedimenticola svalbardensis TaxID=2886004 RepID=A0A8J6XZF7_9BACT|nr:glycine cleavage system aminomethyltransferase GcvT [Candidatus Polarisedimenticola svalbardensis]